MRLILLFISLLMLPSLAIAHGGGLDKQGCHHNRKQGGYHCHRGALAGQKFYSKSQATNALQQTPEKAPAAAIRGRARVVDGDTIWIDKIKIRLHGIDAPETKQKCHHAGGSTYRCGEASTDALRVLIGADPVRCEGDTYDRYKRLIAVCYSDTVNLNSELVRQGWALAYRRYSKDYVSVENEAQDAKRGMWAWEFTPPWEWRRK